MRRSFEKKVSLLSAFLAVIVLLSSCSKSTSPKEPEKDLFVIGFSQVGSESDWRLANTRSMEETFTNAKGYELVMENARQQQENQIAAVRRFILENVDLIIIAPTTEEGWENVLTEAHEAGIPVIIMDRSVNIWNKDLYLTNVGSDFLNQGNQAVAWLEKETEGQFSAEDPLHILHLQGTYGATAQLLRTKALEVADEAHDDWQIDAQLYGDFTEAKGYEVTSEYLNSNQDIDVIYSENDNMTFGAMRALDEAGITYGEGGQVKIITFDATKKALQYCLDGKIDLCVECNPLHGPLVEELIKKYRAGEPIDKIVYIEEAVYTRQNLTQKFIDLRTY